jgi:hypothetical protein
MLAPRRIPVAVPDPASPAEAPSPGPLPAAADPSLPGRAARMPLLGPPPLLEGEDVAAFNDLLARVSAAVRPADILEEMWLREYIDLAWEVLRYRRLKAALINSEVCLGLAQQLTRLIRVRLTSPCKGEVGAQSAPGGGDTASDEQPPPSAYALAERFMARDPQAIEEVEALLASAGQGLDEALARALACRISDVERIDRMIASAETRRNGVLRELERHRATLGAELRRVIREAEAAQGVEDAVFEPVS